MRTILRMLSLSVLLWAPATAADRAVTGDLAKLQGRWTAKAGPKRDIAVVLDVEGSEARFRITTAKGLTFKARGEIKLDETAEPRALDWVKFDGPDDQQFPEIPAIYELKGDKFKVCNGGPNNNRPTEFKAGDGILADLLVFQRVK